MNCTYVVAASAVYNAVFCVTDPQMLDPAELGLLPADAHHRAAGQRRERPPSRPVGRRQHRSAAEADRPPARRVRTGRARARRRLDRRLELATCSSAASIRDRRVLLELPLRRHGCGRDGAEGRQRRRDHAPLELPQHPGRGVRAPLSAAHRSNTASPSTPAAPARHRGGLGHLRGRSRSRPTRSPSARSSTARRSSRTGLFGGLPGARLAAARPPRRQRRLPCASTRRSASPRRRSSRTSCSGAATASATSRPGGAGFGDPAGRDPELVREDVREGYVTAAAALRDYGIELDGGEAAT